MLFARNRLPAKSKMKIIIIIIIMTDDDDDAFILIS
jgi:hypothetical protein